MRQDAAVGSIAHDQVGDAAFERSAGSDAVDAAFQPRFAGAILMVRSRRIVSFIFADGVTKIALRRAPEGAGRQGSSQDALAAVHDSGSGNRRKSCVESLGRFEGASGIVLSSPGR
jgi:hypothetical protein